MAGSDSVHRIRQNDEVLGALLDIARWIRFLALKPAKEAISSVLKNEEDREIYALSDGRSTREIAKALGTSKDTVGRRWAEWTVAGLMRESSRFPGRKEAMFTFGELGFPMPDRVLTVREATDEVADRPAADTEQEQVSQRKLEIGDPPDGTRQGTS